MKMGNPQELVNKSIYLLLKNLNIRKTLGLEKCLVHLKLRVINKNL